MAAFPDPTAEAAADAAAPALDRRLDDAALAQLRALDPDGRAGVVARVLTAFEASLGRSLARLDDAAVAADAAQVGAIAHLLKSSSASVGALALSATCATAEAQLRGADASAPAVREAAAAQAARIAVAARAALVAVGTILRP